MYYNRCPYHKYSGNLEREGKLLFLYASEYEWWNNIWTFRDPVFPPALLSHFIYEEMRPSLMSN